MRPALLLVLLAGCGPGPWEARWTGALTRVFTCPASGGTSSQDIAADWTMTQRGRDISVTPGWGCGGMLALVDAQRDDWADFAEGAGCPIETYSGGITNSRHLLGGYLNRYETRIEVVLTEVDVGSTPRGSYECQGISFGVLERVDD